MEEKNTCYNGAVVTNEDDNLDEMGNKDMLEAQNVLPLSQNVDLGVEMQNDNSNAPVMVITPVLFIVTSLIVTL